MSRFARTFLAYSSPCLFAGILWRKDPKILLSVSKDCSLYQHIFKDAYRPADQVNPIAMDLNLFGDVAIAASDRILSETTDPSLANYKPNNYTTTRLPFMFRRGQSKSEQFQIASSTFHVFQNTSEKVRNVYIGYALAVYNSDFYTKSIRLQIN